MGSKVYNTMIRVTSVSRAPSYGKPVLVYDLNASAPMRI